MPIVRKGWKLRAKLGHNRGRYSPHYASRIPPKCLFLWAMAAPVDAGVGSNPYPRPTQGRAATTC
jgi:hypothetical protein